MPVARRRRRAALLRRDGGVCAACGRETLVLGDVVRTLREDGYRVRRDVVRAAHWEADHVLPLAEGGTDDLGNLQTLCGPCHDAKTGEQAGRRARSVPRRRGTFARAAGLCRGSGRRPARRRLRGGLRVLLCPGCYRLALPGEVVCRRIGPHPPAVR